MRATSSRGESRRSRSASRRRMRQRSSSRSQSRARISSRCCRTRARFPCIVRRWQRNRGIRPAGVAVTNGAFTPTAWEIGSHIVADAQPALLERLRKPPRRRPLRACCGSRDGATRFRAGDLDVTYTVPPGEVARLKKELRGSFASPRMSACTTTASRSTCRPSGLTEVAAGACDGDRSRNARRGRYSAMANGPPTVGFPGCFRL